MSTIEFTLFVAIGFPSPSHVLLIVCFGGTA